MLGDNRRRGQNDRDVQAVLIRMASICREVTCSRRRYIASSEMTELRTQILSRSHQKAVFNLPNSNERICYAERAKPFCPAKAKTGSFVME